MDMLAYCRAMASFCRQRAQFENEDESFWVKEAEEWESLIAEYWIGQAKPANENAARSIRIVRPDQPPRVVA